MGTSQRFSKEFKEAIVKKLMTRGNKTIEQFCSENNLAISTVSRWQTECANVLGMKHKKDKSNFENKPRGGFLKINTSDNSLADPW